jgi:hypothetical protein
VGLVILDEPRGAYYGGAVAAPVFRDIVAAWAMQGLGPVRMPASEVLRRDPAPEPASPVTEEIAAAAAMPPGTTPDLRGLDMREAVSRAASLGRRPEVRGSGRVVDQVPAPGTPVERGGRWVLLCATRGQ